MINSNLETKIDEFDSVQWKFVYPNVDSNEWYVEIVSPPFRGLTVRYKNARVEQMNGESRSRLFFDYDVINEGVPLPNARMEHLHAYLGNILAQIVLEFAKTMTMVDDERQNNTSNSK